MRTHSSYVQALNNLNDAILIGEFVNLGAAGTYLLDTSGSVLDLGNKSSLLPHLRMLTKNPLSFVAPRVPKNLRAQFFDCLDRLLDAGLLHAPPELGSFGVLGSRWLAELLILSLSEKAAVIYTDFEIRNLRSTPATRLISLTNWQNIANHGIDLAIIAADTVEPDHAVLDYLRLCEVPFLIVKSHQGSATVGPLVPGRSQPCQKCHDLALSDEEPVWPKIVCSLTTKKAVPLPASTSWAVSMATMHSAWYVATGESELFGSALELTDSGMHRHTWDSHPDCPCGSWTLHRNKLSLLRVVS